jgi:membrane-associated protease RseP (regulator of RpoE activity)
MPAAGVGLAFSKVIPGIAAMGSLHFGTPPFLRLLEMLIYPGATVHDIYLHPIARAAWVGLFATALNLLPAGQLDGGHIIYALFGKGHKWVTRATVAVLVPIGAVFWNGWLLWAAVLFFLARRHPPIYDLSEVGATRWKLGVLALVLFLICFTLAPID